MKLNIDRLRVLAIVQRTGSLAAAARDLGVGASAISQQISSFEREIGHELLIRSTKPATLTPLGIELAAHGSRILDELERAGIAAEAAGDEVKGSFNIACIATIAVTVLTDAIRELQTTAPGLEVHIHDLEFDESVKQLDAQRIDLSIVDGYDGVPAPLPADVVVTELGREPVQIYVAKDVADRLELPNDRVPLDALASESWVMPPPSASCGAATLHLCHAAGFEPNVKLRTNDLLLLRSFVENGYGVAALPRLALFDPPPGTVAINVDDPSAHRTIRALSRTSTVDSQAERLVLEALQRAASRRLEAGN